MLHRGARVVVGGVVSPLPQRRRSSAQQALRPGATEAPGPTAPRASPPPPADPLVGLPPSLAAAVDAALAVAADPELASPRRPRASAGGGAARPGTPPPLVSARVEWAAKSRSGDLAAVGLTVESDVFETIATDAGSEGGETASDGEAAAPTEADGGAAEPAADTAATTPIVWVRPTAPTVVPGSPRERRFWMAIERGRDEAPAASPTLSPPPRASREDAPDDGPGGGDVDDGSGRRQARWDPSGPEENETTEPAPVGLAGPDLRGAPPRGAVDDPGPAVAAPDVVAPPAPLRAAPRGPHAPELSGAHPFQLLPDGTLGRCWRRRRSVVVVVAQRSSSKPLEVVHVAGATLSSQPCQPDLSHWGFER